MSVAPQISEAIERPTRKRYGVMVFLGLLAFLTYFDRQAISSVQTLIGTDLKISKGQMSIIFGVFWFAYALFEIPGGWLADWFGARKALARVVLGWSLFTALSGCAVGFWSLFAYRLMFGVGEAGAYPSMARVQSKWLPISSRAWFGGVLWMLSRWGAAFSPAIFVGLMWIFRTDTFRSIVGARLASLPEWRMGFFVSGLMGVVWVIAFYPWFRDDPLEKAGVNEAELAVIKKGRSPRDDSREHDVGVFAQLFTSPSMWVVAGIGITMSYCFSFYVSWLPEYYKEVHHMDLKQSYWLASLPMFFAGLACLITGRLSDSFVKRTGKKWLGRAMFPMSGMVISAACMLILPHVRTPAMATTVLCVAAFSMDMNQACHWANIVDIGGRYAAIAFGFMNMIGNIGNAFGPPINWWLFSHLGWGAMGAANAAVFMIAFVLWIFNDPEKRFYKDSAPRGFEPVVE